MVIRLAAAKGEGEEEGPDPVPVEASWAAEPPGWAFSGASTNGCAGCTAADLALNSWWRGLKGPGGVAVLTAGKLAGGAANKCLGSDMQLQHMVMQLPKPYMHRHVWKLCCAHPSRQRGTVDQWMRPAHLQERCRRSLHHHLAQRLPHPAEAVQAAMA